MSIRKLKSKGMNTNLDGFLPFFSFKCSPDILFQLNFVPHSLKVFRLRFWPVTDKNAWQEKKKSESKWGEVWNEVLCYSAASVSILSPDFWNGSCVAAVILWQAECRRSFHTGAKIRVTQSSSFHDMHCRLCTFSPRFGWSPASLLSAGWQSEPIICSPSCRWGLCPLRWSIGAYSLNREPLTVLN